MQINETSESRPRTLDSERLEDIVVLGDRAGLALGVQPAFSARDLVADGDNNGTFASRCVEIPVIGANGEVSGVLCHTSWYDTRGMSALRPQQEMHTTGDPARFIVHDINNVLAVIASGLRLIERQGSAEHRRAIVSRLQDAITRGAMLSRQFLDTARQQCNASDGSVAGSRLAAMAGTLDRALHPDVAVRTAIDSDLWAINADCEELYYALLNLCRNSADAMPKGGTITILARNVEATAGSAAGFVEIAVVDDGIGMPQDVLSKAAIRYFTTKPVGSGSGLGLYQVYRFAEGRGGAIRIESEPGVGTAVRIVLPRVAASALPISGVAEIAYTPSPDGGVFHVVDPATAIPTS
ncbi:ATP-binding protein [Mesorhizobium sp. B2-2-4]|uniref:ATP-binding protein n=1 Tax=unclassified Mesorhizobium TaxID=325217 RepID=UPI0011274FFC|nr:MULTISPECIES: ATP-binding protein [unclassified Mesorhizobium]MBZ9894593.1 ATP-binding protein [Mesorhizobium sp. BR1-1-6]TPM57481.1 ATP-binding protein [Mesorhizobium sp. B2-2-4]TPM65716.1 ATP-binding protein [Mesorhizobium sp. B2-2-1]TPN72041.1 ATP-binding protein [Mesorhizobium sp. B1-1-3]